MALHRKITDKGHRLGELTCKRRRSEQIGAQTPSTLYHLWRYGRQEAGQIPRGRPRDRRQLGGRPPCHMRLGPESLGQLWGTQGTRGTSWAGENGLVPWGGCLEAFEGREGVPPSSPARGSRVPRSCRRHKPSESGRSRGSQIYIPTVLSKITVFCALTR
jgi:hypothetical protein